jgi:hypothetical protein
MVKLAGVAYSRKHKTEVPVYIVYGDIMTLLDGEGQAIKIYREKLLGRNTLKKAPPEYWAIELAVSKGFSLDEWAAMDIHNRAKIMAQHYLKAMIEVVDAHYKEQDDAINRATDKKGK